MTTKMNDDEIVLGLGEVLRQLASTRAKLKEREAADTEVAERLRNLMSTCFDGSRSGDLAYQLADMEEWIPKFTSEWKSNHRRWLELCTRLGLDALDLEQRGRVAEVDAVAGDALELKRIRSIVDEDARKRHGDRESEPSWGVIADCVLAHVSQHRQARKILDVPEQFTLDQYVVETSQHLRDFETSLVNAGKWDPYPELPLSLLAREIVAQAERWRIDAEHYRGEASNATATMVESLSAEVAQLTGEVAATQAGARRQIETLRETANRKLGEMREHNKAHIIDRERACMERDKARSENAALREEVQMWRDRAESDRKRDVTRVEEFKSALAEALGEQALAYQAGERKSHSLEVMRGIMRLELAMAEVLRSLARGEQKSNGKVEIIEPIADHDVERSEAPTRVFSADSSVEGLHRRLEEADIRLAGLQDESASLRLSLQRETRKVIEYSDLVDQYKMAMAQVQGASAAQIAAALNPSLGATALRHTLAAQLRVAAKTASAWEEAAIREWAPLAPDYHDGDGMVDAAIEGPYIEHRLVMAWRGQVQRMAENLSADAQDDAASSVQILDYSKPPPGYNVADRWSELEQWQREGCWAEYKAHNDPPGMWTLYWESEAKVPQGFAWGYFAEARRGNEITQAAARAAAWAWYDRRLTLVVRAEAEGVQVDLWPRALTWSDANCARVDAWLPTASASTDNDYPEVLRDDGPHVCTGCIGDGA